MVGGGGDGMLVMGGLIRVVVVVVVVVTVRWFMMGDRRQAIFHRNPLEAQMIRRGGVVRVDNDDGG